MSFFRQYIAPLLVVLIFLVSLLVVSARIFLPADMAAPAPVEEVGTAEPNRTLAGLPVTVDVLVHGIPDPMPMARF